MGGGGGGGSRNERRGARKEREREKKRDEEEGGSEGMGEMYRGDPHYGENAPGYLAYRGKRTVVAESEFHLRRTKD